MDPGVNLLHVLQGNTPDHGGLHDHCRQELLVYHHKGIPVGWHRTLWLTAPCPVTVHTLEPRGHLICSPTTSCTEGQQHLF